MTTRQYSIMSTSFCVLIEEVCVGILAHETFPIPFNWLLFTTVGVWNGNKVSVHHVTVFLLSSVDSGINAPKMRRYLLYRTQRNPSRQKPANLT